MGGMTRDLASSVPNTWRVPFEVRLPLDVYHFTGGGASPAPGKANLSAHRAICSAVSNVSASSISASRTLAPSLAAMRAIPAPIPSPRPLRSRLAFQELHNLSPAFCRLGGSRSTRRPNAKRTTNLTRAYTSEPDQAGRERHAPYSNQSSILDKRPCMMASASATIRSSRTLQSGMSRMSPCTCPAHTSPASTFPVSSATRPRAPETRG